MKRLLLFTWITLALLSFHTHIWADDGQRNMVRFFLATGETLDIEASHIDSITCQNGNQTIWFEGVSRTMSVEMVDSVWYMSPTLRFASSSLDFGKVPIGDNKSNTITVTNTGSYPETYMIVADGIFGAKWSGKEITIGAGQSLSLDLFFRPTSTKIYTGSIPVLSSAVDEGLMNLTLIGEGIATDLPEEEVCLPPVEMEFDIVVPEDEPIEDMFDGFKIANFNGEYPIQKQATAPGLRKVHRKNATYYSFPVTAYVSPSGLQTHYLTDENDNPYLETISLPGKTPEFSFEQQAIALLMRTPELQTSNLTEYNNAVQLLRGLSSFPDFVSQVRKAFYEGKTRGLPPDYNNLNPLPVFTELLNTTSDSRDLRFSGVSLTHVNTTPQSASFRLHNDFRRTIHAYTQRVKMNESNLVVVGQEDASPTVREMLEALLDEGIEAYKKACQITEDIQERSYKEWIDKFEALGLDSESLNLELDLEDLEFLEIQREYLIYLEDKYIQMYPALGQLARFHLPYVLEAVNSDYIDMVGDGWDAYLWDIGKESSVFETESGTIEVPFNDYDKIFVNVYGMGMPEGMSFLDMPQEEQVRLILVLLTSGYHDYIEPFWKTITGIKEADKLYNTNYKFDLRYGKRKYPEWALLAKLFNEFNSDFDNVKELAKNLDKGDFKAIAKQLANFLWNEMKKIPEEKVLAKDASEEDKEEYRESKRTYVNLIYNIYKKYSGNSATSEEFRKTFKKEANKWLGSVNFIFKWMDIAESGVDFLGAMQGLKDSKMKETFVLDKVDKPFIYVTEPTMTYLTPDVTVHFEWETFQGKRYGEYVYDLELMNETSGQVSQITVLKNIPTTQCDYRISDSPESRTAMKIFFRIVARDSDNPSYILATSEFKPLVWRAQMEPPEMVDLGLPSGTLWATSNVGAIQTTDPGNYYAWAETTGFDEGKTTFSWKNYRYSRGANNTLTKYCTKSTYGQVDNRTQIDADDDVMKQGCGYYYAIPTKEDWDELINNCTWTCFGNIGVLVHSKVNANSIVLPFAGYRSGYNLLDGGSDCYYWSSTLDASSPDDAWLMHVSKANGKQPSHYDYYRCQGRSIRPVLHPSTYLPPQQVPERKTTPSSKAQPVEKHENGLIISTISRASAR